MKIFNNIENYKSSGEAVIALGFFDGVHMGHRSVLERAKKIASEKSLRCIALTFDKCASNVISGKTVTPIITSNNEKAYRISELGIDELVFIPFLQIKDLSPDEFFKKILIDIFHGKHFVCGENYTFGAKKQGNIQTLAKLCQDLDCDFTTVSPVFYENQLVSSTKIRSLISNGEMELANTLLCSPYSICSKVEWGKQLGRTIGVPTINQFFFNESIIPKHGVYISKTTVGENEYPSISNIGLRPTVDCDTAVNIETHIIKHYFDLYDKDIRIELYKYIRPEIKFDSLDQLKEQIQKDILLSKQFFN
ncbi:MAG: bifunctional riboflavin kinase/FAD synthetase [Ruminococcaceae bacterium]|nr:bifunctional riboflavin kinase/FAD synthetase [Oscillospiraceae bacterium]